MRRSTAFRSCTRRGPEHRSLLLHPGGATDGKLARCSSFRYGVLSLRPRPSQKIPSASHSYYNLGGGWTLTRALNAVPSAIAAILLFGACVNLTRNLAGGKDAGENDGPASSTGGAGGAGTVAPDAGAGSGGSVAAGGTTTGGMIATGGAGGVPTTGGTSGTATGGAAGDVAPDAGAVAGTTSSRDGAIDVPLSTDTSLPVDQGTGGTGAGGVTTGGTGGTATGGATAGGTGGTATGGSAGSQEVDAEIVADATSPGDGGIDVPLHPDTSLPLDLGTGGSDGPGTGGTGGTGGAGTGGAGTGGAGTGGATGPMIISVRFVGGRTGGVPGIVAMDPNDVAGVKQVKNWNSVSGNQGSLSSLLFADGSTATGASVGWSASDTWTVGFTDTATSSDSRMMSGYLDPRATALPATPATINVTLPSSMSGAYDVYVYCYANLDNRRRTYRYAIGTTPHTWTQQGPNTTTFPGYNEAPEGGTGNYDYVRFQNVTGSTFTLTATPVAATGGASYRAPVNGIQIVYPSGS